MSTNSEVDTVLMFGEVTAIEAVDYDHRGRRYNVTVQDDNGNCINVETTQRRQIDQRVTIALRFAEVSDG